MRLLRRRLLARKKAQLEAQAKEHHHDHKHDHNELSLAHDVPPVVDQVNEVQAEPAIEPTPSVEKKTSKKTKIAAPVTTG